jgi:hypothetical protein
MSIFRNLLLLALFVAAADAFTSRGVTGSRISGKSVLFMGRAAAVRAATKAKTDGAKAKNNGRFAKKIIMAGKFEDIFCLLPSEPIDVYPLVLHLLQLPTI